MVVITDFFDFGGDKSFVGEACWAVERREEVVEVEEEEDESDNWRRLLNLGIDGTCFTYYIQLI